MDEATNEASLDHKIPQRPYESTIGSYVDESIYRAIGTRLSLRQNYCENWTKYSRHWNKDTVRLYTLLRMLGFRDGDNVFRRFESEDVDDFWLPLNPAILKKIKSELLPELEVLEFAKAQSYVMSDSKKMDEENLVRPFFARQYNQEKQRSRPRHRHLEHGIDHFTDMGQIGEGSSAHVRHFRHEDSGKESGRDFACKRLLRLTYTNLKDQRNQLEYFRKEIEALTKLEYHRHIVSLVASFTDLDSFSLILYPIADKVLLDLLKQTNPLPPQNVAILYKSFNCLATALEFLHANSIRHKDVKPSNILLSDGRVLLCDFGISHKWTDSENGTTEGGYSSFTHRYAAPEVLRVDASRNSKADIWSLGCVFLEVLSVLKGYSFDHIMKGYGLSYSLVEANEMKTWPTKINVQSDDTTHNILMDWVLNMIRHDPKQRLDAGDIVRKIHADAINNNLTAMLLASCCWESEVETHSRRSVGSLQNVGSYVEAHTQNEMHSASVKSSSRPYRHGSIVSSQGEKPSGPVRNPSIASTSTTAQPFRVRQGRSTLSNAPVSAVFSPSQTPFTTPGTSVRSNSACYDPLTMPQAAVEAHSEDTLHSHRTAWPITHGSPCGARMDEALLFTNSFITVSVTESATIERTSQCCNTAENTVQVFETARVNDDAPIWSITRRLVLSDFTFANTKICYSFWLPLTDIVFSRHEATVTLRWSDCNHLQQLQETTHSHEVHWSWIYNPAVANNEVCIQFRDGAGAKEFIDTIRFPRDGGSMLEVSATLEVHTWHVDHPQTKKKFFVITQNEGGFHTSRLYIIGKYINPLIQSLPHNHQFSVQLDNIECPTYLSNLRKQTSKGRRIARFEATTIIPSSLTVSVPISSDLDIPIPPGSITTLFQRLVGWELRFFATGVQLSQAPSLVRKSFMPKQLRKNHRTANVMLWRRDSQGVVSASVTFRFPEEGDHWMSGRSTAPYQRTMSFFADNTGLVSTLSAKDHESRNAVFKFNMFGKQRGKLLDTTSMTAVPESTLNDPSPVESNPGDQQELRRLELRFQNLNQRQVFEGLFEELARSVSEDQPRLKPHTSLTAGSLIPGTPLGR